MALTDWHWPWPLAVLMTWLLGQFVVGYLFNEFLMGIMWWGLLLILTMLTTGFEIHGTYAFLGFDTAVDAWNGAQAAFEPGRHMRPAVL